MDINAFPWRASWVLPTSRSPWAHWDSVPGAPRSYTRLGDGKAAVAADACESSLRMLPSSTLAERRFKGKTVNDAKTVTAGH